MAITMNISGYEIERAETASDEYSDEAKRAEWDTQLAQLGELPATADRHTDFPPELVNADIDAFLQRMQDYRR